MPTIADTLPVSRIRGLHSLVPSATPHNCPSKSPIRYTHPQVVDATAIRLVSVPQPAPLANTVSASPIDSLSKSSGGCIDRVLEPSPLAFFYRSTDIGLDQSNHRFPSDALKRALEAHGQHRGMPGHGPSRGTSMPTRGHPATLEPGASLLLVASWRCLGPFGSSLPISGETGTGTNGSEAFAQSAVLRHLLHQINSTWVPL